MPHDQMTATAPKPDYEAFIKGKVRLATTDGFTVEDHEINPILKPHQRAVVRWAVEGGKRALFESFGLGKTVQQLEILRLILKKLDTNPLEPTHRALIVAPLGVRQEFKRDAEMLGIRLSFVRKTNEVNGAGLFITNYESVRDGKLDPLLFDAVSLDEASVLRGFGGTKTFREFMAIFAGDRKTMNERTFTRGVKYRFVATATPSPNEYIELLAYAGFLDIMEISQAKTRFFKRDSEKADNLTLHAHKEKEFWLWVSSWAMFLQKPSDLGYDDTGYDLPEMKVIYHEVEVDHLSAEPDKHGRGRLFREASAGLQEAAKEKRDTLGTRIEKMKEILAAAPEDHFLIWHDLEAERHAITKAVPGAVAVYGSQDLDKREQAIIDFSDGKFQYLAAKPVIAGSGCNFQRHCHKAIFLGIGYKFNDFIQAIHRIHRFLQDKPVEIHIIYAESEKLILQALEEKWERDRIQRNAMTEIIHEYGLSHEAMAKQLVRGFGVERKEIKGEGFTLVNNDAVEETAGMEENSVGLIVTSVPFSTQYEYSPNYNDFGHTDNNEHFFEQMDFLTPNLLRVLKPGRIAAIHVKDRIVPGGLTGLGFQTSYPFHAKCIEHYTKHGFAYLGMKTIVTDVVRENNQTYRLGWTEQCKDGTKMGVGMPEYLLLFRKPPTDTSNSYADEPVVKSKDEYSRSRWQIDAHAFARSSGERLLTGRELKGVSHDVIYKMFRKFSLDHAYDFQRHVEIGESLDDDKRLPVTFMLLPPQSWHQDVWTDVTRMRTLNANQYSMGRQMHLCPLQFDIVDRAIEQWSNKGDLVLDPFGGIGTVAYRAVLKGRRGYSIELSPDYFFDSIVYCEMAEQQASTPTLFDLAETEADGLDGFNDPELAGQVITDRTAG
jgi:DNA modification methylase